MARIIVQHRLGQETPQDPVLAETVVYSWTSNPTRIVWHSVPEVELCSGALPCNAAIPTSELLLTNWYVLIKIANATQFAVRRVAETRKKDEHFISVTINNQKSARNYRISFCKFLF